MFLFAGLGNPGPKYAGNRHNIGFMVVDAIARRHRFSPWRRRFQGAACEGEIEGQKVLALLPETFMNESGRAVAEAQRFYKIELGDVFAFHDELDLPPAKVRAKIGGGNAGHNGLRSITAHCGNDYGRVRLGIGHPGDKALVHSFVLGDFAKAEQAWVEAVSDGCAELAGLLVARRLDEFQSRLHLLMEARGFGAVDLPGAGKR
ncbi:aminoacyl-tRNA hydrolase [Ancylobacter amanitiformis]|uniref:Peptidyl-tRNA hydrolase n=1 Tax=Ancylobacter amanitiformis TaxID=217069 RepID=A0ABU0LLW5_9HYPH|nr:aminoacyl-tRNA hydrolase [Ancylobacter amanitiformis]MDQ0509693.1 PTH1 family peptidyl-tRNA hydrolase [Ancylobacter amanitiformis]